jgi:hypothetical protein
MTTDDPHQAQRSSPGASGPLHCGQAMAVRSISRRARPASDGMTGARSRRTGKGLERRYSIGVMLSSGEGVCRGAVGMANLLAEPNMEGSHSLA